MNFKLNQQKTTVTLEMTCTSWHNEKCTGNMINRFEGTGKAACVWSLLVNSVFHLILHTTLIGPFYASYTQTRSAQRTQLPLRPRHAHAAKHDSPAKTGAQARTHARTHLTTKANTRARKLFNTHLSALAFSQLNWKAAAAAAEGLMAKKKKNHVLSSI